TILSIDEEAGSMTFAGDIPEGTAQLMMSSTEKLVDGAADAAETTSDGLGEVDAQFAILVSCVGRKLVMRQRVEEELEVVLDVLGEDMPTTGFYSYGELCPYGAGEVCELHNQTMTITAFAETD